jgi:hypothetical protein
LVVGIVVMLLGVVIAAGPFISVSRVGAEMLAELPKVDGAVVDDQRVGWSAMFNDDFVAARRTYSGTSPQAAEDAYRSGGLEHNGVGRFSRACCGDYDGVRVVISQSESGAVTAELAPADSDWQAAWPLFTIPGLLAMAVGVAITVRTPPTLRLPNVLAPPSARLSESG